MIEHTIYKEFIDKISELSDGIYPIITDLDNDLSYVPDKTADFFGFEAGEHTCFFEQLSSCVNDVDLPEYKQEIRYRLNGEKPDDIFYKLLDAPNNQTIPKPCLCLKNAWVIVILFFFSTKMLHLTAV